MSRFLPVGGGARAAGGAERIQPVTKMGLPSTTGSPDAPGVSGIRCSATLPARIEVGRGHPALATDEPGQPGRTTQDKETAGVDR